MTPPLGKDMHEQMAEREDQQARAKAFWDCVKIFAGFVIVLALYGFFGDGL